MSNPLNTTPTADGQELTFYPDASPTQFSTRFYYVNGINTDGSGHRDVAEVIANITQSPVVGIYNLTNGMAGDLKQCLGDWMHIVRSQLGEEGFFADRISQSAINKLAAVSLPHRLSSSFLHAMREAFIAPNEIKGGSKTDTQMQKALARNLASLTLYQLLARNVNCRQIVVAHSQGNLVTSFALWGLQAVYGSKALSRVEIRSISSPSPAWPRGINNRIKVYGQSDDPVTWFDPKNFTGNRSAGNWDRYRFKSPFQYVKTGGIAAHDVVYNINTTNLYRRLRADAGIAPF